MKILDITGVTESEEITLLKGVGSVIVSTDLNFDALTNETITLYVQKADGNKYVAQDLLLKDFLSLGTYGEDALQSDSEYDTIGMIELTEDGGYIDLGQNEVIKFKLRNLVPLKKYRIDGVEEPTPTKEILMYTRRVMASATLNEDIKTIGYDLMSLQSHASISEVQLTWDNKAVTKHSIFELQCMQRSIDPVFAVLSNLAVMPISADRVMIPLKGIINVQISKSAGTDLNISMRIDESDWLLYGHDAKKA